VGDVQGEWLICESANLKGRVVFDNFFFNKLDHRALLLLL